jgi:DNA-directed RNA polymerase subunit RPC12/RpoP
MCVTGSRISAKMQGALMLFFWRTNYVTMGRKLNLVPEDMQLQSTITCPKCAQKSTETMPTNACQYFYDCVHCGAVLKPLSGDCCVFCSYGTVPCPPIQAAKETGETPCCAQD